MVDPRHRQALERELTAMRATALAIAAWLATTAPAAAELGACKADAQETPLCGSGKGAARVVANTISPDKKFALAWRHPDMDPADVTRDDDGDLEILLIRLADGVVLAKADTEYFRNPGVMANRRNESAIWSPDSSLVVRQYDIRFGTDVYMLYRIGADGTLNGQLDLDKMIEDAVYAQLKAVGRKPDDYSMFYNENDSTLGNDGTLRFGVIAFVVKKDPEVDYQVEVKVTPGTTPMTARIVKIVQTHAQ